MSMDPQERELAVDAHLSRTGLLVPDDADLHLLWLSLSGNLRSSQAEQRLPEPLYEHWIAAHEGLFDAFPGEDRREMGFMRVGIHKALAAATVAATAIRHEIDFEDYGLDRFRSRVTVADLRRILSVEGVKGLATGTGRRRLQTIYGVLPPHSSIRLPIPVDDFIT